MSSGLRLLIRLPSSTTSLSTHVPPALRISSCRLGQLVTVRPLMIPAETGNHVPWQHRDRLLRAVGGLHKSLRLRQRTDRVAVDHAAWQHHGVVVVRARLVERGIHVHGVALVDVPESLDLAGLRGNDVHRRARLGERAFRLDQLGLFKTVHGEYRYLVTIQRVCHACSPSLVRDQAYRAAWSLACCWISKRCAYCRRASSMRSTAAPLAAGRACRRDAALALPLVAKREDCSFLSTARHRSGLRRGRRRR